MTITERADPDTGPDPGRLGVRRGDGADDPVTGPMPAVDLHDGRVRVHVDRGVTVVALDGGLDEAFARQIGPTLRRVLAGAHLLVVDLDQVALLEQAGLAELERTIDAATGGGERCLVASRLSGRMVLERWGVTERTAVFTSVADALQAKAFLANGYGDGWRPSQ